MRCTHSLTVIQSAPPPPFGSKGGDTISCGGGGDPIPTMGQTLWYSRYTIILLRVMLFRKTILCLMQLILFKTEVICQWDLLNIFKKLSKPRNKKICIIAIGNK